jgi:DNA-binding XRE family transcriptional regulator
MYFSKKNMKLLVVKYNCTLKIILAGVHKNSFRLPTNTTHTMVTTVVNSCPASGQLIRLLRQIKGVKQSVLAKKLGITQQAFSKLENCKSLHTEKLQAIIQALGVSDEDVESAKKLLTHTC